MKTTRILSASSALLSAVAFLFAAAPSAHAAQPPVPDLVYTLTFDLSSLNSNPNGPFSLDLQLITGSGNVSNTVKLSNFVFTGGTSTGTAFQTGGVSGSLASGIVLSNSSNDNELALNLSSGVTQVSFTVDQSPNSEVVNTGTPIPDQFNVAVLDGNFFNVPTTDPSGGDVLASSALGANDTVANSVKTYTLVASVPEPSSTALVLLGASGLIGMLGLRRRSA